MLQLKRRETTSAILTAIKQELDAMEAAMDMLVVLSDGTTRGDLKKVFESVQNKEDWKAPLTAFVPRDAVKLTCDAVEFFHGARPRVIWDDALTGRVLLKGDGYCC